MKDLIKFDEFQKLDIRIGTVLSADKIEGSKKLIKVVLDMGEEKRQVVAGFGKFLSPEDLIGKQVPIAVNIEPATLMGVESNGVFIAVDPGGAVLLVPEEDVPNGSIVH
jgi:methionine--tRNA ligase beta chain